MSNTVSETPTSDVNFMTALYTRPPTLEFQSQRYFLLIFLDRLSHNRSNVTKGTRLITNHLTTTRILYLPPKKIVLSIQKFKIIFIYLEVQWSLSNTKITYFNNSLTIVVWKNIVMIFFFFNNFLSNVQCTAAIQIHFYV